MKKALSCCLLTFFFCFTNQVNTLLTVRAEPTSSNKRKTNEKRLLQTQQQQSNNDDIKCIDLADFYYEIILGVSSFPERGTCNDQEEAEIAALLQKIINTELKAIPGTIKTQNKVCKSPINTRRRLMLPQNGSLSFSREQHLYHQIAEEMTSNERNLVVRNRKGRRSFIYVGGGRCRFCFFDNHDARLLSSTTTKGGLTTRQRMLERSISNKYSDRRNLLSISKLKYRAHFDKVADILLCDEIGQNKVRFVNDFYGGNHRYRYPKYVKWINIKDMTMRAFELRSKQYRPMHFIGPYLAGDSFGAQLDMNIIARANKIVKAEFAKEGTEIFDFPVREGIIEFYLYCFDLPAHISPGVFFDHNPIIIFVNGIKLDFKLLMSQSGRRTIDSRGDTNRTEGNSFAGIKWDIIDRTNEVRNHYSYGPQLHKVYSFRIRAPMVVLDHKNVLDIDFILRPNAPAKKYALRRFKVILESAHCEVTGLEHSPFDDFQSVVESRLFHKLGVNLAHAFQGKQGHCLYDKIPVVNVNLVQKETWKDSNPNCG